MSQVHRWALSSFIVFASAFSFPATAVSDEKVLYLFPAPPMLPANGPIRLALGKGYFKAEGLDVSYEQGKGGLDVAKQVGAGNAAFGGGLGDSAILVRPQGVPVKGVALIGGRAFMQLVVREDANVDGPQDLKGRPVSVMAFQDTTYFALQGVLAKVGLSVKDVQAQAVGPVGVWQLVASGKTVACACVPDWIPSIRAQGTKIKVIPSDTYFPSMAQALLTSDAMIKEKPETVRKFVRALLRGMRDITENPKKSASEFVSFVPEWKGKEPIVTEIFEYYATLVYPGQSKAGVFDPMRVAAVQDFYIKQGIISGRSRLEDLFTNEFVQ